MKLPKTFVRPLSTFNPYYGLRFGIHMHWDREEHWDNTPLNHPHLDSSFICCMYHETYLFRNHPLLKIYINTHLKDFLKDYE